MAIREKPTADEKRIRSLIEQGGDVKKSPEAVSFLQVRLPRKLVARIDGDRNERIVPLTRHAWIVEAILEKLGDE